jgi:hypothetical protein
MSNLIFIKPVEGRRILDPVQDPPAPLPPEGAMVENSIYWIRRFIDGDVSMILPTEHVVNPPKSKANKNNNKE